MKKNFVSDFRFMTYNHCINIPKRMIEWTPIEKIHKNPKLIRSLEKMPKPVFKKYTCHLYSEDEDDI